MRQLKTDDQIVRPTVSRFMRLDEGFTELGDAGFVFLIDDEVRHKNGRVVVPGDDVLALVDADGKFSIPNSHLLDAVNLRVLLVSSPRDRKDRNWLIQSVGDSGALYVMEPWSREEFLVTSFVHSAPLIRPLMHFLGCS